MAKSKSLIIVESPAKARTLKKYLGAAYDVRASVGHIIDLPAKRLGVKIDKGFEPEYVEVPGKKKVVTELKKAALDAKEIFLASDPDREGEAIAWHVANILKSDKPIHRVLINEITPKGVKEALSKPGIINQALFEAQQARRILDRLVGYTLSPLLNKKVQRGLSAGRVQSVAVRLVCEREQEVNAFNPVEYWSIMVELEGSKPPPFTVKLAEIDGKKAEISNEKSAQDVVAQLNAGKYLVEGIENKTRKRNPQPPFVTAKLQQDAARKLRMTAKKTMALAQRLYEGMDMGEQGPVGLITYMRTDSVRVSAESQAAAREVIAKKFGPDFLPPEPPVYKSKKSAQEAHEAIRPTDMSITPEMAAKYLDRDHSKLYELIYNRFLASQTKPAVLDQITVSVTNGKMLLRATATTIKFQGFLAIYGDDAEEKENGNSENGEDKVVDFPPLSNGQELKANGTVPNQHFTQPPPRFTEASLVKELEEQGIGRPSTYAQILSVIQDRGYTEKKEGKFYPTELGTLVNGLLVESFPEVLNAQFTARMEDELDLIEEGRLNWRKAIEEFWGFFNKKLEEAKASMRNVKKEREEKTDIKCSACGKEMVVKWGKRGNFLACSGFPACKNTHNFRKLENGEIQILIDESASPCTLCGGKLVVRQSKTGRFLGCANYPQCKFTTPFTIDESGKPIPAEQKEAPTGEAAELPTKCPECGSPLMERAGRWGKFLACSKYPECKTTVKIPRALQKKEPAEPAGENCEKCGSPMVIRKGRYGPFMACSAFPKCRNIKKTVKKDKEAEA